MHYMKEILKSNKKWVIIYLLIGLFNAFMSNYKADCFQKVIDGLNADRLWDFVLWHHSFDQLWNELYRRISVFQTRE